MSAKSNRRGDEKGSCRTVKKLPKSRSHEHQAKTTEIQHTERKGIQPEMSFENILNKEAFKLQMCAQCKLCSSDFLKADFCYPIFVANRKLFVEQFIYKIVDGKSVLGDAASLALRRPTAFKMMFCTKPGACMQVGSCSRYKREYCYSQFYNQLVGMEVSMVGADNLNAYGLMLDDLVPRTTDAFLEYIEEGRSNRKSKNDAFEDDIIDAQYEELTTTKDEPEDGPMILSSERKKFLRTVEGILANRNSQQYRIRKSPESLKAKAAGQVNNSKSSVSVSSKRRKKNLGNSKGNKPNRS